jgi:hypothetical protein
MNERDLKKAGGHGRPREHGILCRSEALVGALLPRFDPCIGLVEFGAPMRAILFSHLHGKFRTSMYIRRKNK